MDGRPIVITPSNTGRNNSIRYRNFVHFSPNSFSQSLRNKSNQPPLLPTMEDINDLSTNKMNRPMAMKTRFQTS